jgi:hypothetical protein
MELLEDCFVRPRATKQSSRTMKPFPAFGVDVRKHWLVINRITIGGQRRQPKTGDSQMRTLSVVLALAFVLVGPSMAGSSDGGLPGIGTFAYNGSPIATSARHVVLVASR